MKSKSGKASTTALASRLISLAFEGSDNDGGVGLIALSSGFEAGEGDGVLTTSPISSNMSLASMVFWLWSSAFSTALGASGATTLVEVMGMGSKTPLEVNPEAKAGILLSL